METSTRGVTAARGVPRSTTRVRRCRDRRTAARVLRQPVRTDVPRVRPLSASSCGCPRSAAPSIPGSDAHDLVMSLYGGMSKGERNRIKTPGPLGDGSTGCCRGPLPGRTATVWLRARGRRPASEPIEGRDRSTAASTRARSGVAPVVQRIFDEFLAGRGLYAIAEGLTATASRRRRPTTRHGTVIARPAAAHGRRSRCGSSCRTRGTPAARSGTSSDVTRCCSTSTMSRSVTSRRCAGTTAASGCGPSDQTHAGHRRA